MGLNVFTLTVRLRKNREILKQHVGLMAEKSIPKHIVIYKSAGKLGLADHGRLCEVGTNKNVNHRDKWKEETIRTLLVMKKNFVYTILSQT